MKKTQAFQKLPKVEFILKRLENILIDLAIKSHKKTPIYTRNPDDLISFLSNYKNEFRGQIKIRSKLNFQNINFNGNSRYSFSFKSPFIPLRKFVKEYMNSISLSKAKVHYYPFRGKNRGRKKAIIYLHGWGKNSLRVEEFWHFTVLQQMYKVDIFALELPYHMSRNPGGFSGQGFLDTDPIRTIEAFRQSIVETIFLYNSLTSYYESIGIVGISLGGHIAAYVSLFMNKNIFIVACLAGTPFAHNLKNLRISPNLVKSLNQKKLQFHDVLHMLDYTEIPMKKKNKMLFLFGGKYDSVIDSKTVLNLGNHLQCETKILPTGHFTFAFSLPYLTYRIRW